MEDLTKQQIVLLTLFVSFVTSLATGIITVSLMDQASPSVTQTINRVVERTIERVVSDTPSSTQAAVVTAVEPLTLAQIVEKVSEGVVQIKPAGTGTDGVTGLGIILSTEGLVLIDKAAFTEGSEYVAALSSGQEFPLKIIQSEIIGDVAFAALLISPERKLFPVTWASASTSIKMGDAVYALSGSKLETGIVKKTAGAGNDPLETTISSDGLMPGSPLFTHSGEVIGFKTASLANTSSFYPLGVLRALAPVISR